MHVAVAVDTPVVALHGATELEDWQPVGVKHRSVKSSVAALHNNPSEERHSLDGLTIEVVWDVVHARLNELLQPVSLQ